MLYGTRMYGWYIERFTQSGIEERVSFGGGSWIVWGGISADGKPELAGICSWTSHIDIKWLKLHRRLSRASCRT